MRFSGGSAAAPGVGWLEDPDTGIWRPGTDRVGLATGGTARWEVGSTGILLPAADNTYDIGTVAARVKDVYFAGTLKFGGNPYVRATHNTTQNLTDATETLIALNTDDSDAYGLHTTGANNSRLTADRPGIWHIWAVIGFAANATGNRRLSIRMNNAGSTAGGLIHRTNCGTAPTRVTYLPCSFDYPLAATDYVEITVLQDSGGTLATDNTSGASPLFGMTWIGPNT